MGLCNIFHNPKVAKSFGFEDVMSRNRFLWAWRVWEVDWLLVFRVIVFEKRRHCDICSVQSWRFQRNSFRFFPRFLCGFDCIFQHQLFSIILRLLCRAALLLEINCTVLEKILPDASFMVRYIFHSGVAEQVFSTIQELFCLRNPKYPGSSCVVCTQANTLSQATFIGLTFVVGYTTQAFISQYLTSISQGSHKPVFLGLNYQFRFHHTLKESLLAR